MGPGPVGGMPSVGVFLRDPSPYLRVSEKTTKNSEQLIRQARPRIEPSTSRLPGLSTKDSGTYIFTGMQSKV